MKNPKIFYYKNYSDFVATTLFDIADNTIFSLFCVLVLDGRKRKDLHIISKITKYKRTHE